MSKQEKAKRIEEHLPSVEAIIEEYRAQGRELTRAAAEKIRERLRADLSAGHVDARDDVLGDDVLAAVAGGIAPRYTGDALDYEDGFMRAPGVIYTCGYRDIKFLDGADEEETDD